MELDCDFRAVFLGGQENIGFFADTDLTSQTGNVTAFEEHPQRQVVVSAVRQAEAVVGVAVVRDELVAQQVRENLVDASVAQFRDRRDELHRNDFVVLHPHFDRREHPEVLLGQVPHRSHIELHTSAFVFVSMGATSVRNESELPVPLLESVCVL